MDKEKTTFIRTSLNNSLENLKQTGIPINTLSQIKIVFSNGNIDYKIGSVKEEILLYLIANNASIVKNDNAIQKKQENLIRDAKMVALCLAYLPHYGKQSKEERLYATEWRRLEREINFHELNEMQDDSNG